MSHLLNLRVIEVIISIIKQIKKMKKLIFILLVMLGLQTQAQVMYCDSISYTTASTINYPLIVSGCTSSLPGVVTWNWTVCNANLCYSWHTQLVDSVYGVDYQGI